MASFCIAAFLSLSFAVSTIFVLTAPLTGLSPSETLKISVTAQHTAVLPLALHQT
ncbi:hypothetical protein [Paenibacillus sp. N3.4]|uniref:hypothetical protein n=1 Tax=Paenibacillus sp. N3.4 TaxID=2603222 RepID=UPI001C9C9017|nr:hypothetical protein [Paenibacillus sp. N3.4]